MRHEVSHRFRRMDMIENEEAPAQDDGIGRARAVVYGISALKSHNIPQRKQSNGNTLKISFPIAELSC